MTSHLTLQQARQAHADACKETLVVVARRMGRSESGLRKLFRSLGLPPLSSVRSRGPLKKPKLWHRKRKSRAKWKEVA